MKPNFALNITDTAISLLHRTSRGWLEVGSVGFDNPDLDEALGYLRASALGLSPHGITTKLILPPGQILYTEVEVNGADKAAREAQIRAALEGRTPYNVDDLVFDWWGSGPNVKVAVVARETLEEAESFAENHRFNPVSFVTTPAEGQFAGEPWFGMSKLAASLLPAGEKVTRDQDPIKVITRELPKTDEAAAKPADSAPPSKPAAEDVADKAAKQVAEKPPETASEPTAAKPTDKSAEDRAAQEQAAAARQAAEQQAADAKARADAEIKAKAEAAERDAQDLAKAAAAEEALRKTEAAKAEMERRAQELAQAEAKRLVEEAEKAKAVQAEREKTKAAQAEAERKRVASEKAAAEAAAFKGVTDPGIAEAKDAIPAAPPFSSRRRDEGATPPSLGPAPKAVTAGTAPGVAAPKAPAAPSVTSIAARGPVRAASDAAKPDSPAAPRVLPAATKAAAKQAEAVKPATATTKTTAAPASEPVAKSGATRKAPAAAGVTASRIPGTSAALSRFKSKVKIKTAAAAPKAQTVSTGKAADVSLSRFGTKVTPRRGKPRFLGLILTLVLLALLAGVAAWSSIYLSRDDSAPQPVQQAATDAATEQASSAASGEDPEAVADAEAAADAEAELPPVQDITTADPAVAAPEAASPALTADATANPANAAEAQADAASRGPQDEIFLAAIDAPQQTFDAVALPRPQNQPDTAPAAAVAPPPFGTQYEFEPDGSIKATANGVVMPGGFWLIAARPKVEPPARPAAISGPAIVPDANAAATPPPDDAAVDAATASTAAISRMEGTGPSFVFEQDTTVQNRRPATRPAPPEAANPPAATLDESAITADPALARLASLRPRLRPQTVVAAAETARKAVEAASLAATAAAQAQAAQDSALSVALSPRPAARPSDFSGAVGAAIAAATREAPRQVAAPEAVPEPEQADEPEVKVSASPRIPTRANVAKQATFKNAINLSKTNLIGVYGTDNKRYALIRSSSGRYSKIRVGDKVDGGTVAAITRNEVRYRKSGKMLTLAMPKG
jgi:hypothetical protein